MAPVKLVPVTVTVSLPAVEPDEGLTPVTVGVVGEPQVGAQTGIGVDSTVFTTS